MSKLFPWVARVIVGISIIWLVYTCTDQQNHIEWQSDKISELGQELSRQQIDIDQAIKAEKEAGALLREQNAVIKKQDELLRRVYGR